jgi:hypothetical protein
MALLSAFMDAVYGTRRHFTVLPNFTKVTRSLVISASDSKGEDSAMRRTA